MSLSDLEKFKGPKATKGQKSSSVSALEQFKKPTSYQSVPTKEETESSFERTLAQQKIDLRAKDVARQKKLQELERQNATLTSRDKIDGLGISRKGGKVQGFRDFLDRVLHPKESDESMGAIIRMNQRDREKIRREDFENVIGKESIFKVFGQAFTSGSLAAAATVESALGTLAGKVGAFGAEKKLKERAGKDVEALGLYREGYQSEMTTQDFSTNEKLQSPRYIAGLIADSLPSTLGVLGAGAVASVAGSGAAVATGVAVTAGALLSFGDAYNNAKSFGLNEAQAEKVGLLTAVTASPLDAIPEFRLFSKFAGAEASQAVQQSFSKYLAQEFTNAGASFLKQGVLESGTEIPQTIIENAWEKTYNENKDILEGVKEAGVSAFFSGGLTDTVFNAANALYKKVGPKAVEKVEPHFFDKTENEAHNKLKSEIKNFVLDSIKENGAKETIDLLSQKAGVSKDVALKIVEQAVDGTNLEENVDVAAEEVAADIEREKIVFSDTTPQLPEEIESIIPDNQKESAGVVWQNEYEADYSDLTQRMSELGDLLNQAQDEADQKQIQGEIDSVQKELDGVISDFAKKYEKPLEPNAAKDNEDQIIGALEQLDESGALGDLWEKTYMPVLQDKWDAIEEQASGEYKNLQDKIATLESIEKPTIAERKQLTALRENFADLQEDIKVQKDTAQSEIEDKFIQEARNTASQEVYFLERDGELPFAIPLTSFENGVAKQVLPYITQGKTLADLKEMKIAHFSDDIEFVADGVLEGEPVGPDNLLVTRFNGEPVEEIIPLKMAFDIAKRFIGKTATPLKESGKVFSVKSVRKLEEQMRAVYESVKSTEEGQTEKKAVSDAVDAYVGNLEFSGEILEMSEVELERRKADITEKARQEFLTRENNNASLADATLGLIRDEMDIAEAGRRVRNDVTGDWYGIPSTFPSWMPEGPLRNKKLFSKIMNYIGSVGTLHYPENPRAGKQRLLVNYIFDQLDARLGVDTSQMRTQIMEQYEKARAKQTNESGNSDSDSEGTYAERFEGTSNLGETNVSAEAITNTDVRYNGAWVNSGQVSYQPITSDKAIQIFREFIPESNVRIEFLKNITTPDGGRAFGAFLGDMVQFVENPDVNTPYHESVHAFLKLFVSKEDREAYNRQAYKDAVKKHGIAKVEAGVNKLKALYQFKLSDDGARLLYGEEMLAEGFMDHVRGKETKSFLARFYEAVLQFLKRIVDSKSADRLYNDMMKQKRAVRNEFLTRQEKHFEAIQKHYTDTTKVILAIQNEFTQDYIKRDSIDQILRRSTIKAHDIDLITRTLAEFDGERINRALLIEAIRKNMFPVTMRVTDAYANYGLTNLRNFNPDGKSGQLEVMPETHIYDTPFEHGKTGHFGAFYKNLSEKEIVVRPLSGERNGTQFESWVVLDASMPITEDTMQNAVLGTFDTRESANSFMIQLKSNEKVKSGLLGHTRVGYAATPYTDVIGLQKQLSEAKQELEQYQMNPDSDKDVVRKMRLRVQMIENKLADALKEFSKEESAYEKYVFEIQSDPLQGGAFAVGTKRSIAEKLVKNLSGVKDIIENGTPEVPIHYDVRELNDELKSFGDLLLEEKTRWGFTISDIDRNEYTVGEIPADIKTKMLNQIDKAIEKNAKIAAEPASQEEKDFFAIGKDFHEYALKREVQTASQEMIQTGKQTGVIRVPTALTLAIIEGHVKDIGNFRATDKGFIKAKDVTKEEKIVYDIEEIPNNNYQMGDIVTIDGVDYEIYDFEAARGVALVTEPTDEGKPYDGEIRSSFDVGDIVTVSGQNYSVVEVAGDDVTLIRTDDLETGSVDEYIRDDVASFMRDVEVELNSLQDEHGSIKEPADAQKILDAEDMLEYPETTSILEAIAESDKKEIDVEEFVENERNDRIENSYDNYRHAEDFGFTRIFFQDNSYSDTYYGTNDNTAILETYTSDSGRFHEEPKADFTREELGLPPQKKDEPEVEQIEAPKFDKHGQYIFDPSNLYSENAQTVYQYYDKTVNPYFRKLRKDARVITDERGLQWWESTVTTADAGEVIMFMPDKSGYLDANALPELSLSDLKAIELPELVELSKELMGKIPELSGRFKTKAGTFNYSESIPAIAIKLDRNLKPQEMAKVLAHELGHLVDFVPENTMKRGNLLGRLASIDSFYKDVFASIIPKNKELREELKALTTIWTPFDPASAPRSYLQYRYSSKELYAEFVSVLFSNPKMAETMAPKFFEAFFENLDSKPAVKKAYFELQDLLNKDREVLISKMRSNVKEMFLNADQKAIELEKIRQDIAKQKFSNMWYRLKYELISNIEPLRDRVNKLKKNGVAIPESENPIYATEERNYLGGRVKAFLESNIQSIYQELHAIGIGWDTFGEKLLYDRIADGDRAELANPKGITQERAQESLETIKSQIGPVAYEKLDALAGRFRGAMKELTTESHELGLISDEQYNATKNNDKYSTFRVYEYLDKDVNAKFMKQVGTLKDIQNPADATMLKMIATIRANEYQRSKNMTVSFLKEYYPEDITEAEQKFVGGVMKFMEPSDKRFDLVYAMEGGKLKGYYMDKYIARSINNARIETNFIVLNMLKAMNAKLFRPVFIQYNPGFQMFNFVRDLMRFWKASPSTSFAKTLGLYYKAIPVAKLRAFGIPEFDKMTKKQKEAFAVLQKLENEKVLSVTYNTFAPIEDDSDMTQLNLILDKYGVGGLKKESKRSAPARIILGFLDTIAEVGDFVESLPKVAGYYNFSDQEGNLTSAQKSFIRRKLGSPDFLDGGYVKPITNEVFLFSNSITQGWRTDIEIATQPETRAGYWYKTVMVNVIPKMLMFLGTVGLFGDDIEKILKGATEYDKTNYTAIPLGFDNTGKGIYFRMPSDEAGRLIGGLIWKLLNSGRNKQAIGKQASDIVSYLGGQIPNVTPTVGLLSNTFKFISGENPYDAFYGRNILSDDAYKAGGKYALKEFSAWVFNQVGGGIFYRFNTSATPIKEGTAEKIFTLPFVGNTAGRFVRVSDYGLMEQSRAPQRQAAKEEARTRLDRNALVREKVREAYDENIRSDAEINAFVSDMITEEIGYNPLEKQYEGSKNDLVKKDKEEARKLRDKFETLFIKGGGVESPVISVLEGSTSNAQKEAVLDANEESMGTNEFYDLVEYAYEVGAISKTIYDKYTGN